MNQADLEMSKLTQQVLEQHPKGNLTMLRSEVKRIENSSWYEAPSKSKLLGKSATQQRYCEDCRSSTHDKSSCWGLCDHCNRRGHRSEDCRLKTTLLAKKAEEDKSLKDQKEAAKKVAKKEKKKKKKAAKMAEAAAAAVLRSPSVDSSSSESESPRGTPSSLARLARYERIGLNSAKRALFKLSDELGDLSESDGEVMANEIEKCLSAKSAGNSADFVADIFPSRTSKNFSTETVIADTGCSKTICGEMIAKELGSTIKPLDAPIKITSATGARLNIIGTATLYVSLPQVQGAKKRVDCCILRGNMVDREILLSLSTLKKWNLVHTSFPMETVDQYLIRKNNFNGNKSYSNIYMCKSAEFEKEGLQNELKDPSKKCIDMKDILLKKYAAIFKEKLGPNDRMNVAPMKLEIDESRNVQPIFHTKPFDVPYHLRTAWESELKMAIDAGLLVPVTSATKWSSRAFAVPKADPTKVRIVSDFVALNKALKRPVWTTESSSQLLRHLNSKSRYFCSIDCTSGYWQVPIHEDSQSLMTIVTQQGRYMYTVAAQGITSASDLFNILTDGDTRYNGMEILKNMDDFLLAGETLEELHKKIKKLLEFCVSKNLKLNPKKFMISEEVNFGGCKISAETIKDEEIVFITPKDGRVKGLSDMPKPKTKKQIQSFCGMISSLQGWYPKLPLHVPNLRKACAGNSKFVWNDLLEQEYLMVKKIIGTQIKISPYDPSRELRLLIDGASSIGVGFILFQWLDDTDVKKGVSIILADSSLFPRSGYSPIDGEISGLDFACKSCHYYIYGAPKVILYSDCSGLLDMMAKPLSEILNVRHQKVLTRIQAYSFEGVHIKGIENKVADCLSRLCRRVINTDHYNNAPPRILPMSKKASVYKDQVQVRDPMVIKLGEIGSLDLGYLEMLNCVENGVESKDIPDDCELKVIEGQLSRLGIETLSNGTRLIVRDGREILVPKEERAKMLDILHYDHTAGDTMLR